MNRRKMTPCVNIMVCCKQPRTHTNCCLAGQEGADKGAFCLWCGSTDGKCSTSVHGKKIDSNCSHAYHRYGVARLQRCCKPLTISGP